MNFRFRTFRKFLGRIFFSQMVIFWTTISQKLKIGKLIFHLFQHIMHLWRKYGHFWWGEGGQVCISVIGTGPIDINIYFSIFTDEVYDASPDWKNSHPLSGTLSPIMSLGGDRNFPPRKFPPLCFHLCVPPRKFPPLTFFIPGGILPYRRCSGL